MYGQRIKIIQSFNQLLTTVTIHQPGYLPWLGFFKKVMNSDVFVFFDDVSFVKNTFYNRNYIKTRTGPLLLTVPVISRDDPLFINVEIDNSKNWSKKHEKSIIYNYSNAPYFENFKDLIESIYSKKYDLLLDLNIEIINSVIKILKIKTKTMFSSALEIQDKGTDKILKICKKLNADQYISGIVWAKTNLKVSEFQKNNISVKFQEFMHPEYNQINGKFIPKMCIIDLLFNEGPTRSKEILQNTKTVDS